MHTCKFIGLERKDVAYPAIVVFLSHDLHICVQADIISWFPLSFHAGLVNIKVFITIKTD